MNLKGLIPLAELCRQYEVEMSFFTRLDEYGLIETQTVEKVTFIPLDSIGELERIIRLQQDLDVNLEGIDVVLNLLRRIDTMQQEMNHLRNRIQALEHDL